MHNREKGSILHQRESTSIEINNILLSIFIWYIGIFYNIHKNEKNESILEEDY